MRARLVKAGLFAARRTDAGHAGAHGRSGATQIETEFVDLVEGALHVGGAGALEHDVARLAVKGDESRAVPFPDVAHLAQHVGVVVHAGRRLHAQRVEFLGRREHLCNFGKARNHPATVAEYAHRSALPVALARLVGVLQLTHQVGHVVTVLGQAFEPGDKAGPGPTFKLVQHGGVVRLFAHACLQIG